jgi:type IV secretory pathway TrbF-like protein
MPTGLLESEIDKNTRGFNASFYQRYRTAEQNIRRWQIMAFLLLIGHGFAGYALWQSYRGSHLPKLYVVEHAGEGYRYAGTVMAKDGGDAGLWTAIVIEQWKIFITAWRTVTIDDHAAKRNWDQSFAFTDTGSQANRFLDAWYKETDANQKQIHDPIDLAHKGISTVVTFDSEEAMPESNTVRIWWTETTTHSDGQSPETKRWQASIAYTQFLDGKEAARELNPFGLLARELRLNPWQEGGAK